MNVALLLLLPALDLVGGGRHGPPPFDSSDSMVDGRRPSETETSDLIFR
jgi:hypothetical protein